MIGGGGVVSACKSYGCLPPTEKAKMESEGESQKANTIRKTSREDKSGTREKEAWSSHQDDYPALR